jgi:hypothetical protein
LTDPTPRRQGDALRAAIDRTMSSLGERSPVSAAKLPAQLASRASRLVDEVARRGEEARAEVARRGEEAAAEVTRRGLGALDASSALTARVLDAVSDTLRRNSQRKVEGE